MMTTLKKYWVPIVAVLFPVLLLISNPAPHKHRNAINEKYCNQNPLTCAIGVGRLVSSVADYNNYYLFSTSNIEDDTMTVGVLGMSFCVQNMDIFKDRDSKMTRQ